MILISTYTEFLRLSFFHLRNCNCYSLILKQISNKFLMRSQPQIDHRNFRILCHKRGFSMIDLNDFS